MAVQLRARRADNGGLARERCKVIDLVVRREVTEYRTVTGVCARGQAHCSPFPDALGAPVQYGPGLSASVFAGAHDPFSIGTVHPKRVLQTRGSIEAVRDPIIFQIKS
jgi:hypothetical protein